MLSVLGQILAVANPNPLSGGRAGHTHTQPTGMLCVCVCVCVCVWVWVCGCECECVCNPKPSSVGRWTGRASRNRGSRKPRCPSGEEGPLPSHGARPVHLIITMIKWFRTSGSSLGLPRVRKPKAKVPIWKKKVPHPHTPHHISHEPLFGSDSCCILENLLITRPA